MTEHESSRSGPSQGGPSQGGPSEGGQKPSVPLEKMIDEQPQRADVTAGDKQASEAAKAPSPEIEAPASDEPRPEDSVADLVENDRRQRS